ncbi:MarC family protein [Kordiimonas pumila]|uniref:UPF0056 membrane protein n=1 Tax=Kordiimonas pumila TaxID=2161677 RepID=A0ABV7D454_9PROT|nr:MarC family protein [Kordiimonas pumila]
MYEAYVTAFIALFVIIDPVGMAPIFAGLTQGAPVSYQRKMAIKGTIVATIILAFFALVGKGFLETLGISMSALRVAGGLMLFVIALEMVFDKRTPRKEEAAHKLDEIFDDISVFPLAMPMLAGPGAIATTMLLMSRQTGHIEMQGAILAALLTVMIITLVVFFLAGGIMRIVGPTVNAVITRVLGVILAALAAQYVLDGLKVAFLGHV